MKDKAKRAGKSQKIKNKVDEDRNIKNKKNKEKHQKINNNYDINMMYKLCAKIKVSTAQKKRNWYKRQLIKEIFGTKEGLKDLSIKHNIYIIWCENNLKLKKSLYNVMTTLYGEKII